MDLLRWVFLQSTAALSVLVGLSLFFLLVYWRRTLRVRPLLIGLAVSIMLFVVQAVVVTPREAAEAVLEPVVLDLSRGRTDALAATLTPDFRAADMNRQAFLAFVRRMLDRVQVHAATCTGVSIEGRSRDAFNALATYSANITHSGEGAGLVPSSWRIRFVRANGNWFIARIEPAQILNVPMRDWRQVEELR